MFVGARVDASGNGFGQKPGAAKSEIADEDAGPFVEHEEDVEDFALGGAEGDGAVVGEEDDLGGAAVFVAELVEGGADGAGEFVLAIGLVQQGELPRYVLRGQRIARGEQDLEPRAPRQGP